MLSRPSFLTDDAVARAVAAHWLPEAAEADYLPWGFGAHHWRVAGGGTTLFVTLDQLAPRHTAASLEAAYAGAAVLAGTGLDVVCAPLPARSGRFTVEIGGGMLSVTPWLEGRTPTEAEAREPEHLREVRAALAALHGAASPDGLRRWAPRVGPGFADELRARTAARPWTSGPLAEEARTAIADHGDAITRWTGRYHELADLALAHQDSWVPTHGEPHHDNQVVDAHGLRLVDWESLALAPRERATPTSSPRARATACTPTPRWSSCSRWTGGCPRSTSTPAGSPLLTPAAMTTTPPWKGSTKNCQRPGESGGSHTCWPSEVTVSSNASAPGLPAATKSSYTAVTSCHRSRGPYCHVSCPLTVAADPSRSWSHIWYAPSCVPSAMTTPGSRAPA
ncbi:phosphotransferase [Streptomyces sp. NEAU-S77]|uniref:phosphotransferase n=1 Tax=Streptomyces sp. NEAU-S77 TaxID=3411033 RepID=UPI003B9FFE2E